MPYFVTVSFGLSTAAHLVPTAYSVHLIDSTSTVHLISEASPTPLTVAVFHAFLAVTVQPTLPLSAAPLCASGTTGSTHPEHEFARSGRLCVSEAPPLPHTASDPVTYKKTPFYWSLTFFTSAASPRSLVSDTYTPVAHLCRSGQGGVSPLCCIASSSALSLDPPTKSISNSRLSQILVNSLVGLVTAVYSPIFEKSLASQGFYGDKSYRYLLPSPSTARFCSPRFCLLPHPGRETGRSLYVPPLPYAPIQTIWRITPTLAARRHNRPKTLYLLPTACSHMLNQNECDDSMLRSLRITTCLPRHGNVKDQVLDPIEPSALSSNTSMKVKLEFEIHLVSLVSVVRFRAKCACFIVKSSHIGLCTLDVAYGYRASHLKFLSANIPASSYGCIKVVFDYKLFFRTIAMGTKVELPFGFLRFAEHDWPLYGSTSSCFLMFSSFFLPLSMFQGPSTSVVNFLAI